MKHEMYTSLKPWKWYTTFSKAIYMLNAKNLI